ncbi:HDOD domain-containing protein [Desulfocurvus sp. DL9XJH121]
MHSEALSSDAPHIRAIARRIKELPAPPSVAAKILNSVLEDSPDFSSLSQFVESDQALTLKVLRMANTAAYGHRGKVVSVEQAIATLGFDTLRASILSVIVRESLYRAPLGGDPLLTHVWKHTLACAVAAGLLADHVLPGRGPMAFAAGMIHDCGQLVLLSALPEGYEPLVRAAADNGPALLAAEPGAVGVEHTQVGKWLLGSWGMPDQLTDAAWLHHHPAEALAGLGDNGRLAAVVGLADILAHDVMLDSAPSSPENRQDLIEFLGLGQDQMDDVATRLGEGFARRAEVFNLDDQDAALFYFQALQRANTKLSDINGALARREDRLAKGNRLLAAIAEAGPGLTLAEDADQALTAALRAVESGLAPARAVCWRVDTAASSLTGLYSEAGVPRSVILALDKDLQPVPESEARDLPEGLYGLLAHYLTRIPADAPLDRDGIRPVPAPPWLTLPLMAEDGFMGELAVVPVRPLEAEAELALSQLAGLTAASIHRLELHDRLEERADRLAEALRKIRRMNHKLLQTERLAAVGQLAAGAAHEINNPLAIIYARTQLLEQQENDPGKKKSFGQMMSQIERITSILTNLMDFARPAPPSMAGISLSDVGRRALELIRGELRRRNVEVKIDLAPDLPEVLGDGNQLEQVVLNLLINAEHAVDEAHPEGGGRVTLRTEAQGGNAVLTVSDNGVGIEAENLNKIFDPFFTTKEEGKGTGLGLSTSYGIVQNHGGDIRFRSRVGEGTDVSVVLPFTPPTAPARSAEAKKRRARDTILVVDDEKPIREILRESLETRGYRVETAADGEQGLKRLKAGAYRLLLLDIRMPLRSGLSLLAEARKHAPDMPVIVLTGMAGPQEVEQAFKLGAFKCVRKPFSLDALMEDIALALLEKEDGA